MQPVDIEIGNVFLRVSGPLSPEVRDEVQEKMSYIVPGYKFLPAFKKNPDWDGTKTVARRIGATLQAPTGLFSYLREVLQVHNIPYSIIDRRAPVVKSTGFSLENLTPYDYQLPIIDSIVNRQRGVAKMATGCHQIGQEILMYDGTIKQVQNVVEGDKLMGPDGMPRSVLHLIRGQGKMDRIVPIKGESFVVNTDHVLTLVRTQKQKYKIISKTNQTARRLAHRLIDIKVSDFKTKSKTFKHLYKLIRTGVDFPKQEKEQIEPYFIGLLLGDGVLSSGYVGMCGKHPKMLEECNRIAGKFGLSVSEYEYSDKIPIYALISDGKSNPVKNLLVEHDIMGRTCDTKYIPDAYKLASKNDRLEILAGLIDSDGCLGNNVFDFISKSRRLAQDVVFICRSLGLAAYLMPCVKKSQRNTHGVYFRVCISGDINIVPCRIPYKKGAIRKQKKNVLRTGFKLIPNGCGNFYGFTLDKDGRYLLGDFTVTHNSGKTEVAIASAVGAKTFPYIFYVPSCDLLEQAYDRFSKYIRYDGLPAKIGRIGAGYCDIQPITIATVQSCQLALEGTYTKYDDEDGGDKTKFDDNQKSLVKDFIRSAQFIACDECQHTSAATIQAVMNNSFMARYRVGFSASPWRDDGLDILIEACFGRRLCDIDASFLIQRGFLVKPRITFNHLKQTLGPTATYKDQYRVYVVENEFRNNWIAQKAIEHISKGRLTIILVKWARHAEILADLIPGSEILSSSGAGKKSPTKRKEIIRLMKEKKVLCAIGTSLLDEGVDIPNATTGIFAGGGKSSTRALQRVGRFIRVDRQDTTKDTAYIEEIHDHCTFLNHHAQMRRKILSTEREFIIDDKRISTE